MGNAATAGSGGFDDLENFDPNKLLELARKLGFERHLGSSMLKPGIRGLLRAAWAYRHLEGDEILEALDERRNDDRVAPS